MLQQTAISQRETAVRKRTRISIHEQDGQDDKISCVHFNHRRLVLSWEHKSGQVLFFLGVTRQSGKLENKGWLLRSANGSSCQTSPRLDVCKRLWNHSLDFLKARHTNSGSLVKFAYPELCTSLLLLIVLRNNCSLFLRVWDYPRQNY